MAESIRNQYEPETVTAPGFFLQEKLDELGMSQSELAARIGRTKKTVNEIIAGKAPIEPETALQLERALQIPAEFWNRAERLYRDNLVRRAEVARLEGEVGRLKSIPYRAMQRLGWLPPRTSRIQILKDLLDFFGVASFTAFDEVERQQCAAFRQSAMHRVDAAAVSAWLRQGELLARAVSCADYDRGAFVEALRRIRQLTRLPIQEGLRQAREICAGCGVAVVVVSELPGVQTHGATRWLTPRRALIQLSLRRKTDDQIWFTFYHEAAHILLHEKKAIFLELEDTVSELEAEANRLAQDLLIKPGVWTQLRLMKPWRGEEIELLAAREELAPGILVGRLQHEGLLAWSRLNHLKQRIPEGAEQGAG